MQKWETRAKKNTITATFLAFSETVSDPDGVPARGERPEVAALKIRAAIF
jgi:hypothetical protein